MKDLYRALGLTSEASAAEIKKAYRTLALVFHPDRNGDKEKMSLINEAYDTLFDPEKKRLYDARRYAYNEASVDSEQKIDIAGYIRKGSTKPYSFIFRNEHKGLVAQYIKKPLDKNSTQEKVLPFESGLYCLKNSDSVDQPYHDIFSFVRAKNRQHDCETSVPTGELTPIIAIKVFTDFLAGNYYGTGLLAIIRYVGLEIARLKSARLNVPELLLYEGFLEIIVMANNATENGSKLISSINKITNYAKKTTATSLDSIIPLFYNKLFRTLYAYALHLYWSTHEDLFNEKTLKQFNGMDEAKELLEKYKERLSGHSENENLIKVIRYVKLLYQFEKDIHTSTAQTAEDYREEAFHLLDWMPVFIDQGTREIIANIFLQIGIKFQQASRIEQRSTTKMADEKMALKMFLTASGIGNHATPDMEMYLNNHVIKYISAFEFQDSNLNEVIPALKKRTILLNDVFPFFESYLSNVTLFNNENKTISLMRHLLKTMIEINTYNKSHSDGIVLDHSTVTLLYQAYEACLKNWYMEQYDPDVEKQLRLDLMEELLFDNAWTFLDVEQRLDSPWIMVDRDEQGWMKPSRSLPYAEENAVTAYRAIEGAEINHKTGEINFFMTPWTQERSINEKAFTLYDVQDMLERKIAGAVFSLDPADADKPYHPFNVMRFSPSQLYESEFINTMLLTDYALKCLTTKQEVQAQYPFEARPITSMIAHLPEYLRQIINEFHETQHASGALHRFWIEAEEVDVALSDKEEQKNDVTRIGLGAIKMVVKKHRMERDIHGELKDVGNEDEGWPIYVLTAAQWGELEQGARTINGSAMIFIHAEEKLFYWENNSVLRAHVPENYRETLIRLYRQPRDNDGKIEPHTKNMPLIYRLTTEMARQTGLSPRYSPEFVFAHKFTTHYEEFAQYLPEFGRLRELSKISVLVRILNGIYEPIQDAIQALDFLLNKSELAVAPDTDVYREYKSGLEKVDNNIASIFAEWRRKLATSVLQKKWRYELELISRDIGTLHFTSTSPEVIEACENWFAQLSRDNPRISSTRLWSEVINPKKAQLAEQLSEVKQKRVRTELYNLFSSRLIPALDQTRCNDLIGYFMDGTIHPLANALVKNEQLTAQLEINKQFPGIKPSEIALALDDGGEAAAKRIAAVESKRQLEQERETKNKLKSGFSQINFGIHDKPVPLEGECLWVPASVRHEVRNNETSGSSRYSFFVYGGVNVQPRVNVIPGRGALRGNSVGGGAFNRANITRGFQSHHIISVTNAQTKNHELLKLAGFNNLNARANRIFLPTHDAQHPSRSIHRGRHAQNAMSAVAKKMDNIVKRGESANWGQSQYRSALRNMLAEERQNLRAGNVALNSHHRPWAKTY